MITPFKDIADLKKEPVARKGIRFPSGFPVPMGKQMSQPKPRSLKFPSPKKVKR